MSNRHASGRRIPAAMAAMALVPPGAMLLAAPAHAASGCAVTTTADAGAGSLRQALLDLASSKGADCSTITIATTGVIALQSGLPLIRSSLTITGPGAQALTIDGGGQHRILAAALPSGGVLTVAKVTLAHGKGEECPACKDNGATSGGAIRATSVDAKGSVTTTDVTFVGNTTTTSGGAIWAGNLDVVITDSIFTSNRAEGDEGGAIEAQHATVTHSTFAQNFSGGDGGAVSAFTMKVASSAFIANQASDGGALSVQSTYGGRISSTTFDSNTASGNGGAVAIAAADEKDSTFVDCRFTKNAADLEGGAISARFYDEYGERGPRGGLDVTASTFDGNHARTGGAIASYMLASTRATNVTFTGNSAKASGGAVNVKKGAKVSIRFATVAANTAGSAGGGLSVKANDLSLLDSIVWGNSAKKGADLNDASRRSLVTYDLFTSRASVAAPRAHRGPGLIFGRNPRLGPLAENGGPTPTMLPAAGSPAIGAGSKVPAMPKTDQRGEPRIIGKKPDLGAVEVG